MTDMIALTRDAAADGIALVRLLRTGQADLAMFIISSYADKPDEMQALVAAVAAFANALLGRMDNPDALLAGAAAAVVSFDPGQVGEGDEVEP